jgi:peptide/nickel transport system permease protein
MYRYVIKRLLLLIPIILGVSFIVFSIMSLMPGDPGSIILGSGASQEDIDQINEELGFYDPFFERYFAFTFKAFAKQDLGNSYRTKLPVFNEIMKRLPTSITLAFFAISFASLVGIPIGILSAVKQYSMMDTFPTLLALFLAAVPAFWLGMMLLLIFSLNLGWFPSFGSNTLKHFFLPTISLGLPYAAQQLRYTRSSMLETIRADYIRTARAKGASEGTVIWKHALKNALLPVITITGINFGLVLGGAIVTETLFSIQGLGTFIVTGIKSNDVPVVMGSAIFLAIFFSVIMLLMDLLYAFVDPRIKARYSK